MVFLLVMRTLRIYTPNNSHINHRAVLSTVVLYITFLVLIYLITGSLHLLTTSLSFPHPPSASGNHKSDLCFYVEGFFFLSFLDSTYK